MTKTTTTYALPPEPDSPVWDEDGNKWERDGDYWKSGRYRDCEWMWGDLLYVRGPLTDTEPEPTWPTAPYVWQDGEVWTRVIGGYMVPANIWTLDHLTSPNYATGARRFAREAVPVTIVPAAEWGILRRCVEDEGAVWDAAEALVAATEALNVETNE